MEITCQKQWILIQNTQIYGYFDVLLPFKMQFTYRFLRHNWAEQSHYLSVLEPWFSLSHWCIETESLDANHESINSSLTVKMPTNLWLWRSKVPLESILVKLHALLGLHSANIRRGTLVKFNFIQRKYLKT